MGAHSTSKGRRAEQEVVRVAVPKDSALSGRGTWPSSLDLTTPLRRQLADPFYARCKGPPYIQDVAPLLGRGRRVSAC